MNNLKVVLKEVDRQGRIVIPKSWREKYLKRPRIIMKIKGEVIEIRPEKPSDLTKFFDTMEVDIKSDLSNWHEVRKELRKVG
ncbi:TPA: AbrB/MazE/SpoVT family DNA-binding domain-containing protein [Candidatus Bathyarchaeota archaeon]|nr:AbrB/MazE/SpoVT family DNA-binding domain-containing protein [Candidatus Bathyarchaeota archaeon]